MAHLPHEPAVVAGAAWRHVGVPASWQACVVPELKSPLQGAQAPEARHTGSTSTGHGSAPPPPKGPEHALQTPDVGSHTGVGFAQEPLVPGAVATQSGFVLPVTPPTPPLCAPPAPELPALPCVTVTAQVPVFDAA